MSERVEHFSLAAQIAAVDRARAVLSGAARPSPRAAERDYEVCGVEAALRTLRWLRAHEAEIRSAVLPKQNAPAPGGDAAPKEDGERRRWSALPLATQAAMRCNEAAFQKFLCVSDAETAAEAVRRSCEVASRSELDKSEAAAKIWRDIEAKYRAWLSDADLASAPASGCAGAEQAEQSRAVAERAERCS